MDIEETIRSGLDGWQHREPPADPGVLEALSATTPIALPEEYLALLRFSNGGGGELAVEPGWFQLWPAEEVLRLNRDHAVADYLPGFFGFGSNGGGELLALDARSGPPHKVVAVPFTLMDVDEAVIIADTFSEFVIALRACMPGLRETDEQFVLPGGNSLHPEISADGTVSPQWVALRQQFQL